MPFFVKVDFFTEASETMEPATVRKLLTQRTLPDLCGVCGGDNSTCHQVRDVYNVTNYGYNPVVRIPRGATNVDIRQHAFGGQSANDDTYIALRSVDQDGEYILNGDFVMSMFRKTIQYGGTTLEYSGSDSVVERVNSSQPLKKDLLVEVLTVGNLYPPQVHFSYAISRPAEKSYKWKMRELPKWSHCDRTCQGKCRRKGDRKRLHHFCFVQMFRQAVQQHRGLCRVWPRRG